MPGDTTVHRSRTGDPTANTLIDRLVKAWEAGSPVPLAELLPTESAASMIADVACQEIALKLRAGQKVRVADYLARYPQVAASNELVVYLLDAEVLGRKKYGPPPTFEEYVREFPRFRAELERHFVVARPALPPSPEGYELLEEIGRGGMGVIYRARDKALKRDVAIKVLQDRYAPDSSVGRRFLEEAQITGQLQHPGIPAIHQVGSLADGRPFLAMKLIKGQTLASLIKSKSEFNTLSVFESICQAVGYAHERGVIHRDLKPENVMVGAFGEVQVMDWGLAKYIGTSEPPVGGTPTTIPTTAIEDPRTPERHDQTGVAGTPWYMAPEQAAGEQNKVDARTDVFALGGILCAMLTGKPPIEGADQKAAQVNAVRGEISAAFTRLDASGAEPELVALCKRCLGFAPSQRAARAGEVATAVARLEVAAQQRARQADLDAVERAERAKRVRLQKRLVAAIVGVVAAAAGVTLGLARWNEAEVRAVRVNTLVQTLTRAPAAELPTAIGALEPHRPDVAPQLRAVLNDSTADPRARLNAAVFLGDEPAAVDHMLARLPHLPPAELPPVVAALEPEARRSPGRLWAVVQNPNADFASRIRHAAVLAHTDNGNPVWPQLGGELARQLVASAAPGDVGAWADVLTPIKEYLRPALLWALDDSDGVRGFVAVGLLSAFDRDDPDELTDLLTRGSPRQMGTTLRALAVLPADRFPLVKLTTLATRPSGWDPAVHTRWSRPPTSPEGVLAARTAGVIRDMWSPAVHLFVDDTAADPDEPIDRAAESRARAILAILATRRGAGLWKEFEDSPDPRVRTYLIHLAAQVELDPALLVEQLDAKHPGSVRAGLLLALGEYPPGRLSPQLLTAASARMIDLYRTDPDAGVHSACRWALHRWGTGGGLAAIDRELKSTDPVDGRGWYASPNGATFAVVRGPVEAVCGSLPTEWYRDWSLWRTEESFRRLIPRDFAVSTTEVTVAEYERFLAAVADREAGFASAAGAAGGGLPLAALAAERPKLFGPTAPTVLYTPTPDCPAAFVSERVAMAYCRWLGEQEGLSEDAQCYPPLPVILYGKECLKPDFLSRTGYRLPTEAEWEVACRAGTRTRYPFGSDVRLLQHYAWHWPNSPDRAQPVAGLKPNALGLFDILGNQFERCHGIPTELIDWWEPMHPAIDDGASRERTPQAAISVRGGSFSRPVGHHRSAFRHGILDFPNLTAVFGDTGFRVARTLRPTTPKPYLTPAELDEVYEFTVGGKGEFAVADPTGPWTVSPKAGTLPATFRAVAPVSPDWLRPALAVSIRCGDREKPVTVTRDRGRLDLRLSPSNGDADSTVAAARFEFRPAHGGDTTSFTFTDPPKLPPYVLFSVMPCDRGPLPLQWWAYHNSLARKDGPTAFAWDITTRWTMKYLDWQPGRAKDGVPAPPTDDEWAAAKRAKPLHTEDRPIVALGGERERPPGLRAGLVGVTFEGELTLPAGDYELTASDLGHRIWVGDRKVADTWAVGWRLHPAMTNRTQFRWPGGICPVRVETYSRGGLPFVRMNIRPLRFDSLPE